MTTFLEATPDQAREGAEWYGDAESVVDDISAAASISREHAAAVISHLSPRTPWTRNLSGAWSLVIHGTAPSCLSANVKRARAALRSADPMDTFGPRAPKTRRFARNILGDRTAVTVDVWAVRTALGDREHPEKLLARVGVYGAVEHAYQLAAARLGCDPTTVQATCWIVERGRSGWVEADAAVVEIRESAELAAAGW